MIIISDTEMKQAGQGCCLKGMKRTFMIVILFVIILTYIFFGLHNI